MSCTEIDSLRLYYDRSRTKTFRYTSGITEFTNRSDPVTIQMPRVRIGRVFLSACTFSAWKSRVWFVCHAAASGQRPTIIAGIICKGVYVSLDCRCKETGKLTVTIKRCTFSVVVAPGLTSRPSLSIVFCFRVFVGHFCSLEQVQLYRDPWCYSSCSTVA